MLHAIPSLAPQLLGGAPCHITIRAHGEEIHDQEPSHCEYLKVDRQRFIAYYNRMTFPVTISITARLDMQDQLAGFVVNKTFPTARLRVGDQHADHRFTRHKEQHRFTITTDLPAGEHAAVLEYMDRRPAQGAIEIVSVEMDGSPLGLGMYQCEYRPFHDDEPLRSHLYMGWPGRWSIQVRLPTHEHYSVTDTINQQAKAQWRQHADPHHIRQMALNIWGEDSDASMSRFEPSDSLLMKYENTIVNCEKALRGQRVLDMGCNHGLYSYMALRHGASHVVGVEPRGIYVDGLNTFARQNDLAMEFRRGYDTDLPRLVREHNIGTVMLMSVDDITNWENMMHDLRKSDVQWVIMQVTALPDTWMDFNQEVRDYAKSGAGMPTGFTLHYEDHNSDTRSGFNAMHRDSADPDTGYQHLDPGGNLDLSRSHYFRSFKSRQYLRKFIDHLGFDVERSVLQTKSVPSSSRTVSHGLYQWYLLRNEN